MQRLMRNSTFASLLDPGKMLALAQAKSTPDKHEEQVSDPELDPVDEQNSEGDLTQEDALDRPPSPSPKVLALSCH